MLELGLGFDYDIEEMKPSWNNHNEHKDKGGDRRPSG